jgi:gliding motility-associated-like protein
MRIINQFLQPVPTIRDLRSFLLGILLIGSISSASAQVCNGFCNSGFENMQVIAPFSMGMFTHNNVPCWRTTAPDSTIEVWGTGFNTIPSFSGNQYVEISANHVSTLYQNFTTVPGTTSTISFAHRGRMGTDVLNLSIGPVGGPYVSLGNFSAGNTAWIVQSTTYTFPNNGNTVYSLRFSTVSTASSNPAEGNFLDAVTVTLPPPVVTLASTDATCTAGGSITATITGGTPNYTYNWLPSLSNSATQTDLAPGTYDLTVIDSQGCTGNASATISGGSTLTHISGVICGDEPYTFNGNTYTQAGTHQFDYISSQGCDSTIVLEIEAHPIYVDSFYVTLCAPSETYTYNGQVYPAIAAIYDFTFQSVYGCDSLVRMHIGTGLIVSASEDTICEGGTVQFNVWGGNTYQWLPANLLSDPTIVNPVATVTETTEFTVNIITVSQDGLSICAHAIEHYTITVVGQQTVHASGDTLICEGTAVQLSGTGAESYIWSPAVSLNDPLSSQPIALPNQTTVYYMQGTTSIGCVVTDSVLVQVVQGVPIPNMTDSVSLCNGGSATISVSGADSYQWSPPTGITPLNGPNVVLSPSNDMTYYCDFTNLCGTVRDSVYVNITAPTVLAGNDTIVCPKELVFLHATGAVSYQWIPAATLISGDEFITYPEQTTNYMVIGTDPYGCTDTAFVDVQTYPKPYVQTVDEYAFFGDDVQLNASCNDSTGTFTWYPPEFLSCILCSDPIARPDMEMTYEVTFTDSNGCRATDQMTIFYDPLVYVPNTFIPDGNNVNDVFKAVCNNIDEFEMNIYNRWGEQVYRSTDAEQGWDGTSRSNKCEQGIYNWTIRYVAADGITIKVLKGHVNLLR